MRLQRKLSSGEQTQEMIGNTLALMKEDSFHMQHLDRVWIQFGLFCLCLRKL